MEKNKEYIEYGVITVLTTVVFIALMAMFIGKYPWTHNTYNSYTLQALSWLQGRLDLGQDYSYLELAIYNGKYYVSFPPFPSYVMLPFALIFGENTPDYLIVYIFDILAVLYLYKLAGHFKLSGTKSMICALFAFICSNCVFTMLNPYVWFIAQSMCFALSVMSIYYAFKGKLGLSLFFWACSVGCRPMQIIYVFVILFIYFQPLWKEHKGKAFLNEILKKWPSAISAFIVGLSYMILNYARFGSITEFGHNYLPEFTEAEYGQFSIEYVKNNLESLFKGIRFADEGRMLIDHFNNISLFIVSPIILFTLIIILYVHIKAIINNEDGTVNTFVCCLGILLLSCGYMFMIVMHKTMGGWHFGMRYANDIIPWMYIALLLCLKKYPSLAKYQIPFAVWGIVINAVGSVIVYNGL